MRQGHFSLKSFVLLALQTIRKYSLQQVGPAHLKRAR